MMMNHIIYFDGYFDGHNRHRYRSHGNPSIEGISACIISEDETKVLMVHEYGKWKLVTGSVESGELPYDTLIREIEEEVGIPPDQLIINKSNLVYLGGWHRKNARYQHQ